MLAQIIDGRLISQKERSLIKEKAALLLHRGCVPGLAVILVGEDPASHLYVRLKKSACYEMGFHVVQFVFPSTVEESVLLQTIAALNEDAQIHGVLIQLPLPNHIERYRLFDALDPAKDVDGLTAHHFAALAAGKPTMIPCTPLGILRLLKETQVRLKGLEVAVVGASMIVGRPMMFALAAEGATVVLCHSNTRNLAMHTRQADVVIVATGVPGLITADMIADHAIIIDVGITRLSDGRLVGDVDFEACVSKASWITPVPGGVGPMTITMLLSNTLRAAMALEASS